MTSIHYRLMQFDPKTLWDQTVYAKKIIESISAFMRIPMESVKGRTRKREVVECRQLSMWAIRKKTKLGVSETGELFGRHHSTVVFSVKNVNNFIDVNHPLGRIAADILKKI